MRCHKCKGSNYYRWYKLNDVNLGEMAVCEDCYDEYMAYEKSLSEIPNVLLDESEEY